MNGSAKTISDGRSFLAAPCQPFHLASTWPPRLRHGQGPDRRLPTQLSLVPTPASNAGRTCAKFAVAIKNRQHHVAVRCVSSGQRIGRFAAEHAGTHRYRLPCGRTSTLIATALCLCSILSDGCTPLKTRPAVTIGGISSTELIWIGLVENRHIVPPILNHQLEVKDGLRFANVIRRLASRSNLYRRRATSRLCSAESLSLRSLAARSRASRAAISASSLWLAITDSRASASARSCSAANLRLRSLAAWSRAPRSELSAASFAICCRASWV